MNAHIDFPGRRRLSLRYRRELRARAEAAVERLVDLLDDLDGDADLEAECEDEGAQCDDEGFDSDTEPNGDERDCSNSEDEGLSASPSAERTPMEPIGLCMDRAGNVFFMKDGALWIGGRLA